MFDDVSPGISPVVEDLAAQHVSADAGVVLEAGLHQMIVARHERVDVLHLEGGVVETGLADSHAEEGVVIGVLVSAIAAKEGCDDILRLPI